MNREIESINPDNPCNPGMPTTNSSTGANVTDDDAVPVQLVQNAIILRVPVASSEWKGGCPP
jgi:hypothetical protein